MEMKFGFMMIVCICVCVCVEWIDGDALMRGESGIYND